MNSKAHKLEIRDHSRLPFPRDTRSLVPRPINTGATPMMKRIMFQKTREVDA